MVVHILYFESGCPVKFQYNIIFYPDMYTRMYRKYLLSVQIYGCILQFWSPSENRWRKLAALDWEWNLQRLTNPEY